jgi:hypothetical protein
MAEVTAAAYQDIRNYIQANWKYVELRDDKGDPITRIQIGGDSRARWTHEAGAPVLEAEVIVQGADADIPIPCIIRQSLAYKSATGGEPFSVETMTPFYIMDASDKCVIRHQFQVPSLG